MPRTRLPMTEKARHELVIPNYRPPYINQLMRGHLRTRMLLEHECREMIAAYAAVQQIPKATDKRRLSVTVTLSGRQRAGDADCIWKGLLDALVACGLLRGDRCEDVELGPVTFSRGERQTRIILEDL